MFSVPTTVAVEQGSIDELARLFEATKRALIASHDDWLGAWFTANRETNEVVVIAQWRDAAPYGRLRDSTEYEAALAQFADRFVGPPQVSVNEVLVQM